MKSKGRRDWWCLAGGSVPIGKWDNTLWPSRHLPFRWLAGDHISKSEGPHSLSWRLSKEIIKVMWDDSGSSGLYPTSKNFSVVESSTAVNSITLIFSSVNLWFSHDWPSFQEYLEEREENEGKRWKTMSKTPCNLEPDVIGWVFIVHDNHNGTLVSKLKQMGAPPHFLPCQSVWRKVVGINLLREERGRD